MADRESIFQEAISLHRQARLSEAEQRYKAVLKADPKHFGALYLLGLIRSSQGDFADAVALIRKALNQNPNSADANNSLGEAFAALNRHEEAIARYEKALGLKPEFPEAENNLGNALAALNRLDQAIAHYEQALALAPDFAESHVNLGNALLALNRQGEAIEHYEKALALKPRFAEAYNNLGRALEALDRHEEAIQKYEEAIALAPDFAGAHNNVGNALLTLDRPAEAIARFEGALALRPDYAEAQNNLGNALVALNRAEEAIQRYDKALSLKANYAEAHWNDGLVRLASGDFQIGWRKYEWRWLHGKLGLRPRDFPQPAWLGEGELAGKTILLHAEQGLGDTLQFVRYTPQVAARGPRVVLEVQAPLVSLLAGLAGASGIIAQGQPLPSFDCHCPMMSLPLAFGTTLETVPAAVPYLALPAEKSATWHPALEQGTLPRIGLVWAGSPTHKNDRNRSIPLSLLLPLLKTPSLRFVALQKELRAGDDRLLNRLTGVTLLGERLVDFTDTAAVVSQLDLVITVDTAVAHLAGALGKPVWILLPFAAEWRWLRDRQDSPWYPSARLFRQPAIGDWESVVVRVREALAGYEPPKAARSVAPVAPQ